MPHSKKKIDQAVRDVTKRARAAENAGAQEFLRTVDALRERVILELVQHGQLTPYTAQTAKAPFVRLADRYALVFLPVTLALSSHTLASQCYTGNTNHLHLFHSFRRSLSRWSYQSGCGWS